MAGYRLCRTKTAENPFYIENISTNIYSMEELCFFMSQNLYLLDETIFGPMLVSWLREELDLLGLSKKISKLLSEKASMAELMLPVMKEIRYLNQHEMKDIQQQLNQMEEQTPLHRKKRKGDCLVAYQKYGNAVKVYQEVLKEAEESGEDRLLIGEVCHNIGCAYARLFQLDDALLWFEKANQTLHAKRTLKSLLAATYMAKSEAEFEQKAEELGADPSTVDEIRQELKELAQAPVEDMNQCTEQLAAALDELTFAYHRDTGL